MNQTCGISKKDQIWTQFWSIWPKFGLQKFDTWFLPLLVVRHHLIKLSSYAV